LLAGETNHFARLIRRQIARAYHAFVLHFGAPASA
jgi:hypothetical protein